MADAKRSHAYELTNSITELTNFMTLQLLTCDHTQRVPRSQPPCNAAATASSLWQAALADEYTPGVGQSRNMQAPSLHRPGSAGAWKINSIPSLSLSSRHRVSTSLVAPSR